MNDLPHGRAKIRVAPLFNEDIPETPLGHTVWKPVMRDKGKLRVKQKIRWGGGGDRETKLGKIDCQEEIVGEK